MPVNMFDKPAEASFMNTYTRMPFREIAMMGEQLERKRLDAETTSDKVSDLFKVDALQYDHLEDKGRKKELINKYQQDIDSLGDLYYKDPGSAKRKALSIGRAWKKEMESGEAGAIQSRHDVVNKKLKALDESWEGNPQELRFIKQQYINQISNLDFDPSTGDYGSTGVAAYDMSYVNEKDLKENIFKTAKNIKADQFLTGNAPQSVIKKGFWEILKNPSTRKFVNFNRAASILASSLTDDERQSAELRGLSRGKGAGQSQIFEYETETDANGQEVTKRDANGDPVVKKTKKGDPIFADTDLGRMLQSGTMSGSFQEYGKNTFMKLKDDAGFELWKKDQEEAGSTWTAPSVAYGQSIDYTDLRDKTRASRDEYNKLKTDFQTGMDTRLKATNPGWDKLSAAQKQQKRDELLASDPQMRQLDEKMKSQAITLHNQEILVRNSQKKGFEALEDVHGKGLPADKVFDGTTSQKFVSNIADYGLVSKGTDAQKTAEANKIHNELVQMYKEGKTYDEIKAGIKSKHKTKNTVFDIHLAMAYKNLDMAVSSSTRDYIAKNPSEVSRVPHAIYSEATGKRSNSEGASSKGLGEKWGEIDWSNSIDGSSVSAEAVKKQALADGADLGKPVGHSYSDDLGPQGFPTEMLTFYNSDGEPVKTVHVTRGSDSWPAYEANARRLSKSNYESERKQGQLMLAKMKNVGGVRLGHAIQGIDLNSLFGNDKDKASYNKPVTSEGKVIPGIYYEGENVRVKAIDPVTSGERAWQVVDSNNEPIEDPNTNQAIIVGGEAQLILRLNELYK